MGRRLVGIAALSSVLVMTWLAGVAHAPASSTLYVGNMVTCDDATLDSSVTPYCTIQAAVDDAVSEDIIMIGAGTYTTVSPTGVVWIESKDLELHGAGQGVTIIDGEHGVSGLPGRIAVRLNDSTVSISDLTIHRGYSTGSGGGLYVFNVSSATVDDVTISDAVADYGGAAVYAGADGVVLLRGVTIDGGDAQGETGGGGGILMADGATVTVERTSILNCNASSTSGRGGAIMMWTSSASLTITDSVFEGNDAGYRGGALFIRDMTPGTLSIDRSTFEDNGTGGVTDDGGAVFLYHGVLTITDSTFSGNQATAAGGAIANFGGTVDVTSSTISGNQAGTEGGGIWEMVGTLSGSTVYGNSAADGGGITRGLTPPVVRNSIIAGNTGTISSPDCDEIMSADHNLIGNDTGCIIFDVSAGDVLNQDPLLVGLADNGGPTRTHRIATASPAHDAGNPATPDGTGDNCTANDQRGFDRDADGGRCDIGAYELFTCDGTPADIIGTPGPDTLSGTTGDDVIAGFGGDDTIQGKGGSDLICGGDGNDVLQGKAGNDVIWGGGGNDVIQGKAGNDVIWGGDGNDKINGGDGDDQIDGGADKDQAVYFAAENGVTVDLSAGTATGQGTDTLTGIENVMGSKDYNDTLIGNSKSNMLKGLGGKDTLWGRGNIDNLQGQAGNDILWGEDGDDKLYGKAGFDELHGGNGDDILVGNLGDDTLDGGAGTDDLDGGAGLNDTCINGGGIIKRCEIF